MRWSYRWLGRQCKPFSTPWSIRVKSVGAMMDPYGTPVSIVLFGEMVSFNRTAMVRPVRKVLMNQYRLGDMPACLSWGRSLPCQTVLKARAMSKKHDNMTLFLSSALLMCSPSLTTWSVTLRPFRKPAWYLGRRFFCWMKSCSLSSMICSYRFPR